MKKNRTCLFRDFFIPGRKYLRIMKLTFLLLLLGLMSFASVTYSQATRLSFESKNATIESVFKKIESLSEFKFAYNSTKLDVEKIISLKVENQTINAILDKILGAADLQYKIVDRYIIITDENSSNSSFLENSTQQQKSVTGKVTDSSGAPMPGVSVVVKGTTNGNITDTNGNYSLSDIPENATLQFSFVGMKGQEVKVGTEPTIDVVLTEETIGIEEVVAIGYGTQRKKDLSGSVVRADINAIRESPNVSLGSALQGTIAGLNVGAVTTAGSDPLITIRGRTSISGSSTPLMVLDGIIYRGNLIDLNPSDIESVDILKDASATAIYGSQASNGVILITSKIGKIMKKPTIEYSLSYSLQEIANNDMLPEDGAGFIRKIGDRYLSASRTGADMLT
ncbi:MAG: carboxypeptidase-like regulatory domain-containing protein, partial [Bacteroidota bacterium]|nr:carboxypeptidase-like regulatory domain-containing protein [Bacteroidota bacterium]